MTEFMDWFLLAITALAAVLNRVNARLDGETAESAMWCGMYMFVFGGAFRGIYERAIL